MKICTKAKELDTETFKTFRKVWSRKGISVLLEDDDVKEFNKAVDEIRKDGFIRFNVTKKFIEEKLEGIISEALELPERKRSDFVEQELSNLRSYFEEEIKEWIFIVPIENLTAVRKFSIGDVKFYVFNNYRKNKIKRIFWNIIKDNKNYSYAQKKKFSKKWKIHLLKN